MATPAAPLTPEEIEQRVAENDHARSTRRAAAARRVGELARRHAAIAEQLTDIERQLGDVLAEADEVVTVHELARFTNLPAAALTRWRDGHKPNRAKRKNPPTTGSGEQNNPARTRNAGTPRAPAQTRPVPDDQPGRDSALAP